MNSAMLVSGAGDLAKRILLSLSRGERGKSLLAGGVICETQSTKRHPDLIALGFSVRLATDPPVMAQSLLISFPPGPAYLLDLKRAIAQWDGRGPALMISTTSVYSENSGGCVNEESPTLLNHQIVEAETFAHKRGVHVLRLAGLYSLTSGPQIYWQKKGEVHASAAGIINLIHRDDAADFCAQILTSKLDPRLWLLSDAQPLTRFDIVQSWSENFALEMPLFRENNESSLGKRVDPLKSWQLLGWSPRYKSFLDFVSTLKQVGSTPGST